MPGVRFSFGAPKVRPKTTPATAAPALEPMPEEPIPEPPAVAAPAPKISRNFLVFSDWNQANITSLAENIIQSAVKEAKRAGKVRLSLTAMRIDLELRGITSACPCSASMRHGMREIDVFVAPAGKCA